MGSLTWSPNGKKIFYVEVAVDEYDENNWPEVFRYLLMMIDVNTGEKTLLLDMGDPGYYVYQSEEGNIIKLEKAGYPKACEIYNFNQIDLRDCSHLERVLIIVEPPPQHPHHNSFNPPLNPNRHRPIVDYLYRHLRPEFADLGGDALGCQQFSKAFHQRLGDLRRGGVDERWAAAFAGVCIECELRDYNGFSIHIQ